MISRKRVVFTTFGSLGDLHPFLAMAVEWQRRGHVAVIATSESYREKVESEGLVFASVRPELPEKDNGPEIVARIMDMKRGPEFLIRQVMVPAIRESYEDLLLACEGADAIIGR